MLWDDAEPVQADVDLGGNTHGDDPDPGGGPGRSAEVAAELPRLETLHKEVPEYREATCIVGDSDDLRYLPMPYRVGIFLFGT